jgi:rSAM/selenodomain-associated transferase 1
MPPVIILFAKAPVPGKVKTRLTPHLTPPQAARLHQALVEDTWCRLQQLADIATLELHTDIATDAWPEITHRKTQVDGHLGVRMLHALSKAFEQGAPQAMIVGSDIPELPVDHLRLLLDSPSQVALGPVRDGGYYAISCRATHPNMFDDVRWSTSHALADTINCCARAGLSVSVGPSWHDVDSPEDLVLLPANLRHLLEEEG